MLVRTLTLRAENANMVSERKARTHIAKKDVSCMLVLWTQLENAGMVRTEVLVKGLQCHHSWVSACQLFEDFFHLIGLRRRSVHTAEAETHVSAGAGTMT